MTTRLKQSFEQWLIEFDADYFITINFNINKSLSNAEATLKKFNVALQRKLYGKHFYNKLVEDRLIFIAIPEHVDSNIHYHSLWKFKNQLTGPQRLMLILLWEDLTSSGSLHIRSIDSDVEQKKVCSYVCKEDWRAVYPRMVISTQWELRE